MDPRAQDVLLCSLCGTDPLLYCCEQCNINLCTNCISKHLSDSSKQHNVIRYHLHKKFTPRYSKCRKHADRDCEFFCDECSIPICSACVTSATHKGHDVSDVLEILDFNKNKLQKDLEELEIKIYPQYENMVTIVQTEESTLESNYTKLTTAADQQGEVLHRHINAIVNRRKSHIAETKSKHLAALKIHTDEITQRMSEIKQVIQEMKNILDTNDIFLTSTYKSRNDEFNKLPPKIEITLPSLSTPTINTEKLNEMLGTLSPLSITTVRSMLAEPRITATIDTGYKKLRSVRCLNEEEVWTRGQNNIMKLLNLQSKLQTAIPTKSRNEPWDITVTRGGSLVYTDPSDRTLNLLKNKQISTVVTLQGWVPLNICCAISDDLLVTMISDDFSQSKVVRYSGFKETQAIQFDDQGRPLYSSGRHNNNKYISENKNLDICVADYETRAVVVVSQSGKFRFRYTGHSSDGKYLFDPLGITTDSQSHILTADHSNDRIHILDQDGHFLRYIQNCHLELPFGLCVDINDNLFVAERYTVKVKKIQYL